MTKNQEKEIIVGLDIGTSKVVVVIGEVMPDEEISIIGVGSHESKGMDKGGVNDLDSIGQSVKRALDQASLMADDYDVSEVYLSISGKHIACQNENGMVSINDEEVTQDDIDNVIHTARSVKIPNERKILHVLPQEYSIDIQEGIKSPIGMSGMRMEAKVHIVTCGNDMAKNIVKSIERCDLTAKDLVFSGIASANAVLTNDEKDLGVCLLDIGGGTTDIAVYSNGALRHCAVLPVAGNQVTSDIAKIFRTPQSHAEQIKVQYASARSGNVSKEETIEVPSVGGRPARTMSRHTLAEVIEPRYKEIFELARQELVKQGFEEQQIAAGIVLTGGTSEVEQVVEVAEEVFGMPVRVARPLPVVKGLYEYVDKPMYATAVGLLRYGAQAMTNHKNDRGDRYPVSSLWHRVKSYFQKEF